MTETQQKQTCCSIVAEAKYKAREKKENRTKSHPWIVLKLTIGVTLGLIGYTTYVYIGRLGIPMIRKDSDALGGRVLGIVFVAVFSLLLLMTLWTYEKVVLTSPGQAKDQVRKSPQIAPPTRLPNSYWDSSNVAGRSYEDIHPTVDLSRHATIQEPAISRKPSSWPRELHTPSEKPSQESRHSSPKVSNDVTNATTSTSAAPMVQKLDHPNSPPDLPPPLHSRRPPTTPILLPEFRYCYRDELIRPVRAHHCRACGTCILKYDHHCPWIGQCVGARNHKFFVNFLQWASLHCLWVFSTTLALNVKSSSSPNFDIDAQHIVIIAIAGLFSLFTVALLATHIRLIILNQTTVESLGFQSMKDHEEGTLTRLHPWHSFGAKRRTKKQWDAEWGKIGTEGNLWWLGSKRANWEAVMGVNPWWWFLPIGRSPGDGMTYPTNPRFDEQGRWRRRKEWPVALQ